MATTESRWQRQLWRTVCEYAALAAVLAALVAGFRLMAGRWVPFEAITDQVPGLVICSVGMTFILVIGAIDLSVGSVLALSSAVLGVCVAQAKLPVPVGILACLGAGLMCGLVNGLVTIRWNLPSFIVTLGMLEMARGGAYLVTGMQTQYIGPKIQRIAEASVCGISLPFGVALATVLLGQFVLSRTVFGRYAVAIGTNEEAVRLSGIDPRPVKLAIFALCSGLTALAAVMHTSRFGGADPNEGVGFELQAIAAVVIGGTSLMGGRGSVVASLLGVLIIAVLGAGLNQLGAQEPVKRLVTGMVIIAAVIADQYRQRLRRA
jgi:ribose transport system permease protein